VLRNVSIDTLVDSNLTSATLDNVAVPLNTGGVLRSNLNKARFFNGFYSANMNTYWPADASTLSNLYFSGGKLAGVFQGAVFTGTLSLNNITFDHLNLCGATLPLQGTSAPYSDLKTVSWGAVVCPNGYVAAGGADNCNSGTRMTALVPVSSCPPISIP